MAKKTMKINGTNLSTYGIYISSDTYLDSPLIDYSEFQVPARSGNVILDNKRLNNVVRKFSCYVKDNPTTAIANLKKLIYGVRGYMKLESDYDPTTYQMGYLAQEIQFSPFQTGSALTVNFDLYFSCDPHKYYNTNTSISGSPNNFTTYGSFVLLPRDHPFIQDVFSQIPSSAIPDSDVFITFKYNCDLHDTNLSSVSMSWTGGSTFMAICSAKLGDDMYEYVDLLAYSNSSISKPSLSTSQTSVTQQYPIFIMSAAQTGSLSIAFTETNGGTSFSDTMNLNTNQVVSTNTSALGVNLQSIAISYPQTLASGSYQDNGVYIVGKLNNVETGNYTITLRNDLYPASIDLVLQLYATGGYYTVYIDLTTNKVVMKKTGQLDRVMNDYFEINGNINGADKLETMSYEQGGSYNISPEWWTL